jgi:hypothetical protein
LNSSSACFSTQVFTVGIFFFCIATSFENAEIPPPEIAENPESAELFETVEGSL